MISLAMVLCAVHSLRYENDRSPETLATGRVKNTHSAVSTFGNVAVGLLSTIFCGIVIGILRFLDGINSSQEFSPRSTAYNPVVTHSLIDAFDPKALAYLDHMETKFAANIIITFITYTFCLFSSSTVSWSTIT